MDDEMIVSLFWARDERAIVETSLKYGRLCNHIANNILSNNEDREECINDTYFAVWNAIPDKHPSRFSVFISRIARNLALKKYEYISAAKRNPSAVTSLEELGDCVSGTDNIESEIEEYDLDELIEDEEKSIQADPTVKNYSYTVIDGKVYYRENSRMFEKDLPETTQNRKI